MVLLLIVCSLLLFIFFFLREKKQKILDIRKNVKDAIVVSPYPNSKHAKLTSVFVPQVAVISSNPIWLTVQLIPCLSCFVCLSFLDNSIGHEHFNTPSATCQPRQSVSIWLHKKHSATFWLRLHRGKGSALSAFGLWRWKWMQYLL